MRINTYSNGTIRGNTTRDRLKKMIVAPMVFSMNKRSKV